MIKVEIRGAERLSFRERQVVALKESGLANETIAGKLELSSSSVNTLLHRARSKGYEVVIILEGDPLKLFEPGKGDENESEI